MSVPTLIRSCRKIHIFANPHCPSTDQTISSRWCENTKSDITRKKLVNYFAMTRPLKLWTCWWKSAMTQVRAFKWIARFSPSRNQTVNSQSQLVPGDFRCESLVVATGGLSIPQIGATGFGYDIARQFGLKIVETAPALDGFNFSKADAEHFKDFAGNFTGYDYQLQESNLPRKHSLYPHRIKWASQPASIALLHKGEALKIDLLPQFDAEKWLSRIKTSHNNKVELKNVLSEKLPKRFAEKICSIDEHEPSNKSIERKTDQRSSSAFARVDTAPRRNRWLQESRSHQGWSRHERAFLTNYGSEKNSGVILHRRSSRCHRSTRWLQLPVGLGRPALQLDNPANTAVLIAATFRRSTYSNFSLRRHFGDLLISTAVRVSQWRLTTRPNRCKKFSKKTRTQTAIALSIFCGSMFAAPALSRVLSIYEQALEKSTIRNSN